MRNSAIWPVVLVVVVLPGADVRGSDTDPTAKEVITNSIGMKFVLIPAGEFVMGSPKDEEDRLDDEKQHRVRITKPFYLGAYEVTLGDFRRFVADTGYKTTPEKAGNFGVGWVARVGVLELSPEYSWRNLGFAQTDRHPVANVSWNDAVAFCDWLSKLEGRTYRLPTEAEWEYACRAGTTTRFYHGDDAKGLIRMGNVGDVPLKWPRANRPVAPNDGYACTSPAGSFRPNDLGLYDMHGNVWEWCQDCYASDYYGKSPLDNPSGPTTGHDRVLRGGSWFNDDGGARSACRLRRRQGPDSGFRCALVPAE